MKSKAKIIMGLAFALAAIAVAIDHASHRMRAPAETPGAPSAPSAPSAPGYGGAAHPTAALAGLVGRPRTLLPAGRSPEEHGRT